jgi:uncharacterized membrane protein
MNSTVNLIFTVIGAALVLLSLYGAVTLNRRAFLSGFCFFSFLPIIGESMAYNTDKGAVHLMVLTLFVVQFLINIPDKHLYTRDDLSAKTLATKIGLSVLVINIAGAVYVLCLKSGVPVQFGYYHVAFALIELLVLVRAYTTNSNWAGAKA